MYTPKRGDRIKHKYPESNTWHYGICIKEYHNKSVVSFNGGPLILVTVNNEDTAPDETQYENQ